MIVDFHSHTYYSDGNLSPQELRDLMISRGVRYYAVTDHDTLGAHHAFAEEVAPPSYEPQRLIGIEINTVYADNEVHILGYGFPARGSSIDTVIADNQRSRLERIEKISERLTSEGFPVTVDEIMDCAGFAQSIGRPHVARALVNRGYCADIRSAMCDFLKRGGAGYVATDTITPFEAIEAIQAAGGIAVLAHPCRLDDYGVIDIMARAGVDGLEVFYPRHTPEITAHFRGYAERYNLLLTAGSDFHNPHHNPRGVGMDVAEEDLRPFLERLLPTMQLAPVAAGEIPTRMELVHSHGEYQTPQPN